MLEYVRLRSQLQTFRRASNTTRVSKTSQTIRYRFKRLLFHTPNNGDVTLLSAGIGDTFR